MIVFRADGNNKIGYGHVMRCLSIADAFSKRGEECLFILADPFLQSRIEARGYSCVVLGTRFDHMEDEVLLLQKLFVSRKPDWMILDSYFITEEYLEQIRPFVDHLACMDDLGNAWKDIDALIDYNLYAESLDYEKRYEENGQGVPKLLLGPSYAPLRDLYREVPRKEIKDKVEDILISTGGTDPIHLALQLMKHMAEIGAFSDPDLPTFHFLIGANADKEEILALAKENPKLQVYENLPGLKELYLKCDLAVSAAGSTLYELCACGVPTITYVLADNQILGNRAFHDQGLMLSLGDLRNDESAPAQVYDAIEKMTSTPEIRRDFSEKMRSVVDGFGADRIAEAFSQI